MCRKESWGAIAVPMEAHFTHRAWLVEVRAKETKSNPPRSIERRGLRPLGPGVGQQGSRRYSGARPSRHLQTRAPALNHRCKKPLTPRIKTLKNAFFMKK